MTTDPFPKEYAVTVQTGRGSFTVGGTAKGSGMIEPNMATMLGFLTTDAGVSPALLDRALRESGRDTFNAITVDGECSTNDSLFALASGASGVTVDEELYPALIEAFFTVSRELALGIVRGGEGATKLISVEVRDARTIDEARQVARTIANSPLVKTAVHGADPNWGRIVAAAGRAGVKFDVQRATVHVGEHSPVRERTAARRRSAARGRALEGQGDPDRGQPGHWWTSVRDDLDMRSQRRVRAHQRRVSNINDAFDCVFAGCLSKGLGKWIALRRRISPRTFSRSSICLQTISTGCCASRHK